MFGTCSWANVLRGFLACGECSMRLKVSHGQQALQECLGRRRRCLLPSGNLSAYLQSMQNLKISCLTDGTLVSPFHFPLQCHFRGHAISLQIRRCHWGVHKRCADSGNNTRPVDCWQVAPATAPQQHWHSNTPTKMMPYFATQCNLQPNGVAWSFCIIR